MSAKQLVVILVHFNPPGTRRFRRVLKGSIRAIRCQRLAHPAEVVVVDDGSTWSRPLHGRPDEVIGFSVSSPAAPPLVGDLGADTYFVKARSGCYDKALLVNHAVVHTRGTHYILLDDDHPFQHPRCLARYYDHFGHHDFVSGRLVNGDGTARRFVDHRVQGTNFGFSRRMFDQVGGLGTYTSEWGCGEDSDFFWKAYVWCRDHGVRGCFDGDIVTRDRVQGRWHSLADHDAARIDFERRHGVDMHDNPSRHKAGWMEYRGVPDALWGAWNRLRRHTPSWCLTDKGKA